jgi:RHS repeat-associated protein
MGCPKLYEGWVFLRGGGGETHPLFPRKPREKNRSRSAPAEMDGYKCVAEIDALKGKVERFYSWTGESLLGIHNPQTKKSLAVLTDGNKNVVGLLDEQGKITAQYAYSPYGGLAKSSGPDADENPFLFSSEYLDSETGLVYYNYRYYSPELGRWTKRDPIEERGGWNLYGMLNNQSVNDFDSLGLKSRAERKAEKAAKKAAKQKACKSAGGYPSKTGNRCCCGDGKTFINPASQCCFNGKALNRRKCVIWIWIGHSSSAEDVRKTKNFEACKTGRGRKNIMVCCWGRDNNAELERLYPGTTVPNEDRPNDMIYPGVEDDEDDGITTVNEAYQVELAAAIIKAKGMCDDLSQCCKKVTVKMKSLDDDGKRWMRLNGYREEQIVYTENCQ